MMRENGSFRIDNKAIIVLLYFLATSPLSFVAVGWVSVLRQYLTAPSEISEKNDTLCAPARFVTEQKQKHPSLEVSAEAATLKMSYMHGDSYSPTSYSASNYPTSSPPYTSSDLRQHSPPLSTYYTSAPDLVTQSTPALSGYVGGGGGSGGLPESSAETESNGVVSSGKRAQSARSTVRSGQSRFKQFYHLERSPFNNVTAEV